MLAPRKIHGRGRKVSFWDFSGKTVKTPKTCIDNDPWARVLLCVCGS